MSKPIEGRRFDEYPKVSAHAEKMLIIGYSGLRRIRRAAPEPERRPLTVYYDESGLVCGEPLSKGRTGLQDGER